MGTISRIAGMIPGCRRFRLEQIAVQAEGLFRTPGGREQLVKSILCNEFPLSVSEYVFEINNGQFLQLPTATDERIKILEDILCNGITEENRRKFSEYRHTAKISISSETGLVFHVHLRESPQEYFSSEAPHFSEKDKQFSRKNPLGLVEYCVPDVRDCQPEGEVTILSRLSLCYKRLTKTFSETKLRLNSEGRYCSDDGAVKHDGRVPPVMLATGNIIQAIQQDIDAFNDDPLIKYILLHSIKSVEG